MASAVSNIPLPYRILLLYFEPLAALNGALLIHFFPSRYLLGMSPRATSLSYNAESQVVYDQLSACYIMFAFNQGVVLRQTSDLRVWKALVLGMLLCDLVHLYGSWTAMGTDMFVNPLLWRLEDWVNLPMLYGPGALRLGLLLEVGFADGKGTRKKL
ncbi:hypothetical protein MMC07_008600 [Pseudocyphellaria aurata]|nr:hypothetical protein [Pseudocyphellaria aurata]